jgi:hypothetical protein
MDDPRIYGVWLLLLAKKGIPTQPRQLNSRSVR